MVSSTMCSLVKRTLLALLIVCTSLQFVWCDKATHVLLAPKQVTKGTSLNALLSVYVTNASSVNVTVKDSLNVIKYQSIQPVSGNGQANQITVQVPLGWLDGVYSLVVEHVKFSAILNFNIISASYAVVIQTDKPIYKPSQTVRFRVAIFDADLRPCNISFSSIIEDANGNKLQQWTRVQTEMGLAQLELPLSDQPPLGQWKITVIAETVTVTKEIKIAEYVLPRFEVTVQLPSFVLISDDAIPVQVSARYTFGEPVIGNVALIGRISDRTVVKNLLINGVLSTTFTKSEVEVLGLRFAQDGSFSVEAEVREPLSGSKYKGSASTDIAASMVKVTWMDINSKSFRPGQNYTAYIEVTQPDGNLLKGSGATLTLTATSNEQFFAATFAVPATGIVVASFSVPSTALWLRLEAAATFNGVNTSMDMQNIALFKTQVAGIYLQVSASPKATPKVGDSIVVDILCSSSNGSFSYLIIAKNRVISSGSGSLSNSVLKVNLSTDHTPAVTVLVYAILQEELLADSVTLSVDGTFQNKVEVAFQDKDKNIVSQRQPGENVTVSITTTAGSMIGVLSVDKSVLLLGGGNDITQNQILGELMKLVKASTSCDGDDNDGDAPFIFWRFPVFGGVNSRKIIAGSGLSVVTDASLTPCSEPILIMEDGIMFKQVDMAAAVPHPQPEAAAVSPAPRRRQLFPETWLWDLLPSPTANTLLEKIAPDTITTWVTTALSMHPTQGISVSSTPAELRVFLPFFVTPVLPYSAVRGEELQLKLIVFNYGNADDLCTVTVDRTKDVEMKMEENDLYADQDISSEVKATTGAGTLFTVWIKPTKIGTVRLSVTAICNSGAGDAFDRELEVKPQGFPQEYCQSEFVSLRTGAVFSKSFPIQYPDTFVDDSERIEVIITGDVMGPSIEGLDRLVQMPYGCGEQNMITFTPNIFVRKYLESIGRLTAEIRDNTNRFMQTGYQRELTYRHKDGSFSAFGDSDPSGSTWLTSFVVKCFRQAKDYVTVDDNVLAVAKTWLYSHKSANGTFAEPGNVIHQDMQGGASKGLTLTAYVVIALLEDLDNSSRRVEIQSLSTTILYLEAQFDTVKTDAYKLAIITYALELAGSGKTQQFLTELEKLAISSDGTTHWEAEGAQKPDPSNLWSYQVGPSTIEMTSYVLLTYIHRNDNDKAKSVAMYLSKNRGSSGGFASTQDTVLGLQALAAYSAIIVSTNTYLNVQFDSGTGLSFVHNITKDNAIITAKHVLSPADQIDEVAVTVSGVGTAIASVCVGYYVEALPGNPQVQVSAEVMKLEGSAVRNVSACAKYVGSGDSGMCVMEVQMPTGFVTQLDDLYVVSGKVSRKEMSAGAVAVYFDKLDDTDSCVMLSLLVDSPVNDVQDSFVTGYQYYKTESQDRAAFNPTNAKAITDRDRSSACHSFLHLALVLAVFIIQYI